MSEVTTDPFAFYSTHGAALFPIPAGHKTPFGIVASFKKDWSKDPVQWAAWRQEHPNCNFGVVAFASGLVILDTDTSGGEAGRAEAWAMRSDLFRSWGMDPATPPHVQSARGGWHDYLSVPSHIDASTLRQPDAIRGRINVRCVGFTVAAGSYYDGTPKGEESGPYLLLSRTPPHPAPTALIEHCTRPPPSRTLAALPTGGRDVGDTAALLVWLTDKGAFEDYESWCQIGMALRVEFGDAGLDLWELTHDNTVRPGDAAAKWTSFATEPTSESVTLLSFTDRAHRMGWTGSIRSSSSKMFDGVAQLAAAAGASLSGGRGMPMMAGQEELCRLAAPILEAHTGDPSPSDWPMLPPALSGHGLYPAMQACLVRMGGKPNPDTLAVLSILHEDVFGAVASRLRAAGTLGKVLDRKIRLAAANLAEKVERITVTHDKWEYDKNGEPQSDNSDNVTVLLGMLGLDLRWNDWTERMEIKGGLDELHWREWSYVDDTVVAALRTRGNRTKTRFRPGKDFMWDTLLTLAHTNTVDPVLDLLDTLEKAWDGTPRLDGWLTQVCGVPNEAYHKVVSQIIIGGMVRRIRFPGCKHDFMPVFFGPQGTGKSTIAKIIADMGQSTLAEIDKRSAEWFSDEVLLGDESKELVLSLAGKCLVEIGEMGQRSANTDHNKAMLSRQADRGRTAYARAVSERPRRNVFFGTVNGNEPLTDTSGNRRYLPVAAPLELNLQWLSDNIRQLVGEAAAMLTAGATFTMPRAIWDLAAQHQEAARAVAPLEELCQDWFERPGNWYIAAADLTRAVKMAGQHGRVTSFLAKLGWRSRVVFARVASCSIFYCRS